MLHFWLKLEFYYRVEGLHWLHPPSATEGHIPGAIREVSPWDAIPPGRMLSGEVAHGGVQAGRGNGGSWLSPPRLPKKFMGSQLGADAASEDGARWLLVWGCSSSGGEKVWLASCWHPDGVLPNWELLGGTGARRMLILGPAIMSRPMSCSNLAQPPSIPPPKCN